MRPGPISIGARGSCISFQGNYFNVKTNGISNFGFGHRDVRGDASKHCFRSGRGKTDSILVA